MSVPLESGPASGVAGASSSGVIGCSVFDLDTPALVVDLAVMERNIQRMASSFRSAGVRWRPHTKAIKVPALAHKLLQAGASGITCAKLGEAEVMAAAGIGDIMIANQVVGETKIARLMQVLAQADVVVAADNADAVAALDRAAARAGRRPRVVVEVDIGMHRAGVAPGAPTVDLARRIDRCRALRFAGLMGWEGHTVHLADPAEKTRAVTESVRLLTDSARQCREAGLAVDIVSCGGTGTYQLTANLPGVTEIQAGGGIFCDVYYHDVMHVDHEYALTVLATVTSRPVPTRIICDAGKKSMSSDAAMPRPLIETPLTRMALSAEHTIVELAEPDARLKVGDRIQFIVGYSDTTTMLHDELYGVRDGRVEAVWPILGRGKLR
ncbi:MAG TPA: DSD1 family PLP-dependent enzyme [Chloroflexota bacterium]